MVREGVPGNHPANHAGWHSRERSRFASSPRNFFGARPRLTHVLHHHFGHRRHGLTRALTFSLTFSVTDVTDSRARSRFHSRFALGPIRPARRGGRAPASRPRPR